MCVWEVCIQERECVCVSERVCVCERNSDRLLEPVLSSFLLMWWIEVREKKLKGDEWNTTLNRKWVIRTKNENVVATKTFTKNVIWVKTVERWICGMSWIFVPVELNKAHTWNGNINCYYLKWMLSFTLISYDRDS